MKKYELQPTDLTTPSGNPLFRVVALRDFGDVHKGDKGGQIESTHNLSNEGNCWVYGNARVYENARVYGNAQVHNNARVSNNARVYGDAEVYDNAWVSGDAKVFDDAWVYGEAWVSDNALVYGNAQVFGNVLVFGKSRVFDNAQVFDNARVYGDAEIYGTTELTGGYAFDTKDNGNGAQSASEKPKTCHGGQTGKFCSNCEEPFEPLPVEDAKSVIDYVRTAIDFDQRTAAWALDEMEGILNNWGHLHGMDLYLEADELVEPACDHVTGGVPDEEGKAMVFRYCPKCGEKL